MSCEVFGVKNIIIIITVRVCERKVKIKKYTAIFVHMQLAHRAIVAIIYRGYRITNIVFFLSAPTINFVRTGGFFYVYIRYSCRHCDLFHVRILLFVYTDKKRKINTISNERERFYRRPPHRHHIIIIWRVLASVIIFSSRTIIIITVYCLQSESIWYMLSNSKANLTYERSRYGYADSFPLLPPRFICIFHARYEHIIYCETL